MKNKIRVAIVFTIITMALVVISSIFLPDTVKIMGTAYSDEKTIVPKIWGIAIATALSVTGTLAMLINKKDTQNKYGLLIISICGYVMFGYMLVTNCTNFKF